MFRRQFRRFGSLAMALLICLTAAVPALAEGSCAHTGAYRIQEDVVDYALDEANPGQHKVITVTYEYTYCPDCGEKFSGKPLNETTQVMYAGHTFVEGYCVDCKYANPCTHANAEIYDDSSFNVACVDIDSTGHTIVRTPYNACRCPDCGEYWTEASGETTSVREAHQYFDGICGTCKFSNPCTHENEVRNHYVSMFDVTYAPLDERYHNTTGYQVDSYRYEDCGDYSFVKSSEITTVPETHAFLNGECQFCHYVCTHKFTDGRCEYCYTPCEHEFDYTPDGRWNHRSTCSICGYNTWNSHEYEDGICTICGYDNHYADGCEGKHIVSCVNETICLTSGQKIGEDDWYSVHHGSTPDSEFATTYDWNEYEHWTVCSVCGRDVDYGEHNFEDGVCKVCGLAACADGCDGYHVALCENPGVCAVSNQAIPSGDYVHIHHGASLDEDAEREFSSSLGTYEKHYAIFTCPLCGTDDVWDWEFHQVTCTNPTCSECGYTVSEDYEYIRHADSDYLHNSTRHWKICPDCGEKHDDLFHCDVNRDGKCDICDADTSSAVCQHIIHCDSNVCENCGETVSPDDETAEVRHYHDSATSSVVPFENGYHGIVCDRCGAVMHKWFHGDSFGYRGDVISHIDANGHGYHCICGIFWYEPHVMVDGVCFECGYDGEAEHILKNMEGDWDADDSGHWRTCEYCDEKVSQAHTYENDKCVVCGYVKGSVTPTPVPTAEPTAEPTAVPTAVPTAEPTAVPTAEPTAVPTAEPTAVPTAVPTAEPTAVPTAKPTAKPTDAPVVTPTPVPMPTVEPLEPVIDYEDVDQTETVHGVVATEPQRIATTLVTAIEQIEVENAGKETSIVIRNVDKVITETEKVVFDTLPAKEQILVLLSSIGYETEVASALSSMDMTLSEDAVALTASIQERLADASEEEKAAFEQMLTDSFPVETITIDGVEYEYFVIELIVDIDGDVHVERYGFRFDENGEWIFTRLSIGTIVE